jgi:hypothetical protein
MTLFDTLIRFTSHYPPDGKRHHIVKKYICLLRKWQGTNKQYKLYHTFSHISSKWLPGMFKN